MGKSMIDNENACKEYDFDGFNIDEVHPQFIEITYNDGPEQNVMKVDLDKNNVNSYLNVKRHREKFGKMLENLNKEHDIPEKKKSPYLIIENGTKTGRDLMKDNLGYNYSRWRGSKIISFRCINRNQKKKKGFVDCKCYLSVINYKKDNMEIEKMDVHNHDPHTEQNIKRDMKRDLKRKEIDNPDMAISDIIKNVIKSNEEYQNFIQTESGSSPKMKSMYSFLQRHRNSRKRKSK